MAVPPLAPTSPTLVWCLVSCPPVGWREDGWVGRVRLVGGWVGWSGRLAGLVGVVGWLGRLGRSRVGWVKMGRRV